MIRTCVWERERENSRKGGQPEGFELGARRAHLSDQRAADSSEQRTVWMFVLVLVLVPSVLLGCIVHVPPAVAQTPAGTAAGTVNDLLQRNPNRRAQKANAAETSEQDPLQSEGRRSGARGGGASGSVESRQTDPGSVAKPALEPSGRFWELTGFASLPFWRTGHDYASFEFEDSRENHTLTSFGGGMAFAYGGDLGDLFAVGGLGQLDMSRTSGIFSSSTNNVTVLRAGPFLEVSGPGNEGPLARVRATVGVLEGIQQLHVGWGFGGALGYAGTLNDLWQFTAGAQLDFIRFESHEEGDFGTYTYRARAITPALFLGLRPR